MDRDGDAGAQVGHDFPDLAPVDAEIFNDRDEQHFDASHGFDGRYRQRMADIAQLGQAKAAYFHDEDRVQSASAPFYLVMIGGQRCNADVLHSE